jgi:glycine hydroxymethyltransferase
MKPTNMPELADLIADALTPGADPTALAPRVTQWRSTFSGVHFTA